MPPVEMMTVVLPAFIASRTSIHVISSSQTVLVFGSGFGVSGQLYGLAQQCPPPMRGRPGLSAAAAFGRRGRNRHLTGLRAGLRLGRAGLLAARLPGAKRPRHRHHRTEND